MVNVNPKRIPGRWREGYALDDHTLSSAYLGEDEFGHPQFATTRSDIGEILYQLKYRADASKVAEIVGAAAAFLASWKPGVDLVVPVPPSRGRVAQPVLLMAQALATQLGVPCATGCVKRVRDVPELKNVYDYDERNRLLTDAHEIDRAQVQGRRVLLFDDLYRSGATMNSISAAIYDQGGAADVFALTITKTRSNQ
jgi:competence protein ComFC